MKKLNFKLQPIITSEDITWSPYLFSYYDDKTNKRYYDYYHTLKEAQHRFTFLFQKGYTNMRIYKCIQDIQFEKQPVLTDDMIIVDRDGPIYKEGFYREENEQN